MRSFLIILTALGLIVSGQASFAKGAADVSTDAAQAGAGGWRQSNDSFVKEADQSKIKSLVNDLLSETPKAVPEEKSFRQSDSSQ